jgi:hypothetical protein
MKRELKMNKLYHIAIAASLIAYSVTKASDTVNVKGIIAPKTVSVDCSPKLKDGESIKSIRLADSEKLIESNSINSKIELNLVNSENRYYPVFFQVENAKGDVYSYPVIINADSRYSEEYDSAAYNRRGAALISGLKGYLDSKHKAYTYKEARQFMFSYIDNYDGYVECVYTGRKLKTDAIPNTDATHFNTEHTWPQAFGADFDPEQSDIFHIRPSVDTINSKRGNLRFGQVVGKISYQNGGSKCGKDAGGYEVCEPRDEVKGDIARGLFYFALKYGNKSSFLDSNQYAVLKNWNKTDMPSVRELERNSRIKEKQTHSNPFIDHPEMINILNLRGEYLETPSITASDSIIVFSSSKNLSTYFYSDVETKLEYARIEGAKDFTLEIPDSIANARKLFQANIIRADYSSANAVLKVKFAKNEEKSILLKAFAYSGVDEENQKSALVYPNPGSESILIKSRASEDATITFYNENGEKLNLIGDKTIEGLYSSWNISVRSLQPGKVFYKILSKQGETNGSFIVK